MVPIDRERYTHTHTYMHVKNKKPNTLYKLKNNRSPFPSLFTGLSLPEAECLEPRATNLGWTKCYILTGSPYSPYGPRDGVASWAMLTEQGEALAACTERGSVDQEPTGSEHLQPGVWCTYGRAQLSLPFSQGSMSSSALRYSLPSVPRKLQRLTG